MMRRQTPDSSHRLTRRVARLSARKHQHFRQEINTRDVGVRQLFLQSKRQISRAGGKISNLTRLPAGDDVSRARTPVEVDATAKHVVREIIASRNGSEHFADMSRFAIHLTVLTEHEFERFR